MDEGALQQGAVRACMWALLECADMIETALSFGGGAFSPRAAAQLEGCIEAIGLASEDCALDCVQRLYFVQGVMYAHGAATLEVLQHINKGGSWRTSK